MDNIGITIALILAFIAIVWMTWQEWRKDCIHEERKNYRAWKQQDNIRWYADQRTEDTRADLIRVWEGLDV